MPTTTRRGDAGRWAYLPEFALANLPRYTSYPPANRFHAGIADKDAAAAIASLPDGASLSLYVHIPFCKKLCWYCGCHTSVPTAADPVDAYLDALIREFDQVGRRLTADASVTHLHFGGGSPDILRPDQADRLIQALRRTFRFRPDAEIAAELDPRGVTAEIVDAFVRNGLTRASLGVQVLAPHVQARINRVQPRHEVEKAIRLLRKAGVGALNVDLMYGLPEQTLADVEETALFAASQDADRVAAFGYAHVPWFKKHQKAIRPEALAGGEERFRQAEAAAATLLRAGYVAVGFDHFAAPHDSLVRADRAGTLRRNFQGYTNDCADALLGFGASAISTCGSLAWQNTTDATAYRTSLAEGQATVARGLRATAAELRTGRVIERILCQFEADIPADMRIEACPTLGRLEDNGLIAWSGHRLLVTERGRPYVRNVAAAFDPGIQKPEGAPLRHSLAV